MLPLLYSCDVLLPAITLENDILVKRNTTMTSDIQIRRSSLGILCNQVSADLSTFSPPPNGSRAVDFDDCDTILHVSQMCNCLW